MLKIAIITITLLIGTVAAYAQGRVWPCSVEFIEERSILGSEWVKISAWTKAKSEEDKLATIKSLALSVIKNMPFYKGTVFLFDPREIKIELGWGIEQSVAFIEYALTSKNITKKKPIWKGSVSVGKYDRKERWYENRKKVTSSMNSIVAKDPNELCGWNQVQKTLKIMNARVGTEIVNLSGIPESHKRFLQNLANAFVFEGQCKKMQVSTFILGMAMKNNGLNEHDIARNGRYGKILNSLFGNGLKVYHSEPTSQVCWTANYLYGPEGIGVPNLMIPR